MDNREQQPSFRRGVIAPHCDMTNCAANHVSTCMALQNNNFNGKTCPFFKTKEQNREEKQAALDFLASHNRTDLIDKYYGPKEGKTHGC